MDTGLPSSVRRPTSCFLPGSISAGRSASGLPTKSFFIENIFSRPRSWTLVAPVDFRAGDVALLDAKRSERFETVGHHIEGLARLQAAAPTCDRVIRSAIDLVRALTGEREPRDEHLEARQLARLDAHERQGAFAQVDIFKRLLKQRAAVRSADSHARPMVGERGERNFQIRPGDRKQQLEILIDERTALAVVVVIR